jgi:hypothetical protein
LMMRRGSALEADAISSPAVFDGSTTLPSLPGFVCASADRDGAESARAGLKNLCAGRSRECGLPRESPVARSVRLETVTIVPSLEPQIRGLINSRITIDPRERFKLKAHTVELIIK